MQQYIIGIDTGGTYTDAVLLDPETGVVKATSKEPTTHHRLSTGTGRALKSLFTGADIAPGQILSVAVSSTLATNSLVEHKGAQW